MRVSLPAFAFLLTTVPAVAGTVITSETSGPKEAAGKSVVYIDADKVRIEAPNEITIFRADQNVAYIVTPAKKQFIKLTPEKMKQMAAAIDKARARMAEQLKSMPPAQRAQIEKMMPGGMSAEPPKLSFRKAGGSGTVGKWSCERIEELANGEPQAKLCVVKMAELGLSAADLAPLQRLSAFMAEAAAPSGGATAAMDPQALEKAVGYPAFAVQMEIPAAGIATTTSTVEKKAVAADLFDLPAGYQEAAMPMPGSDAGGAPARGR